MIHLALTIAAFLFLTWIGWRILNILLYLILAIVPERYEDRFYEALAFITLWVIIILVTLPIIIFAR